MIANIFGLLDIVYFITVIIIFLYVLKSTERTFFQEVWDKITFPIFVPNWEKFVFVTLIYKLGNRVLYYTITADPKIPLWLVPNQGLDGLSWGAIMIPPLPGGLFNPFTFTVTVVGVALMMYYTMQNRGTENQLHKTYAAAFYGFWWVLSVYLLAGRW